MPIVVNLDVMMARRHKGAGELAEEIGKQFGVEVDKRKVVLDADIKAFGTFGFEVKFYNGITTTMSVAVCEKE